MQRRLLSSYEIDTDTTNYGNAEKALYKDQPETVA